MPQIKCYQYWPCGEEYGHVGQLEFGNFRIYYRQELRNEYFTIRSLELENISVSRKSIVTENLINCYCFIIQGRQCGEASVLRSGSSSPALTTKLELFLSRP